MAMYFAYAKRVKELLSVWCSVLTVVVWGEMRLEMSSEIAIRLGPQCHAEYS